jgi:hypothetical protein
MTYAILQMLYFVAWASVALARSYKKIPIFKGFVFIGGLKPHQPIRCAFVSNSVDSITLSTVVWLRLCLRFWQTVIQM